VPNQNKQRFIPTAGFLELGFTLADYVYFGYGISSVGTVGSISCFSDSRPTNAIYTFFAHGDLDGDGTQSTFELAVGAGDADLLARSRGLYIRNEVE
jgi:hypothetical protein